MKIKPLTKTHSKQVKILTLQFIGWEMPSYIGYDKDGNIYCNENVENLLIDCETTLKIADEQLKNLKAILAPKLS